jgi:uncharacterized membrane protein
MLGESNYKWLRNDARIQYTRIEDAMIDTSCKPQLTERKRPVDTRLRSIVKAIIWQLMGLVVMIVIGFAVTGSFWAGGVMGVINALIGVATYMIYERVWAAVSWGRKARTNLTLIE